MHSKYQIKATNAEKGKFTVEVEDAISDGMALMVSLTVFVLGWIIWVS